MAASALLFGVARLTAAETNLAAASPKEFVYTNDGFSITLPPGWREISPEEMRTLRTNENLRVPVQGLVHIFQNERAEKLLTPPLILAQVNKRGRKGDFEMRFLCSTNARREHLNRMLRHEEIPDGNIRNVDFDTNHWVLHVDSIQENNLSRDRALTSVFYTEEGSIVVTALSTELDFSKWSATFRQIMDSVRLAENTRYQLRPPPDLSGGSRDWIILAAGVGGMILLVGGWLYISQIRSPSTLEY